MPGDEVDDTAGSADAPATDDATARRPDGAAGGAGGPAVEWLARRLNDAVEAGEKPTGYRPDHAVWDVNTPALSWPNGQDEPTAEDEPTAGNEPTAEDEPTAGNEPTAEDEPTDEPTGEWPAPGTDDWAEEVTDPTGFAPVYGPPSDPFEEDDEAALPGWGASAVDKHAAVGRRRILVVAGVFLALAGLLGVILLIGRADGGVQRAAGSQNGGGVAAGNQGGSPVRAPVGGRTSATFELVDGAGAVKVRPAISVTTSTGYPLRPGAASRPRWWTRAGHSGSICRPGRTVAPRRWTSCSARRCAGPSGCMAARTAPRSISTAHRWTRSIWREARIVSI